MKILLWEIAEHDKNQHTCKLSFLLFKGPLIFGRAYPLEGITTSMNVKDFKFNFPGCFDIVIKSLYFIPD